MTRRKKQANAEEGVGGDYSGPSKIFWNAMCTYMRPLSSNQLQRSSHGASHHSLYVEESVSNDAVHMQHNWRVANSHRQDIAWSKGGEACCQMSIVDVGVGYVATSVKIPEESIRNSPAGHEGGELVLGCDFLFCGVCCADQLTNEQTSVVAGIETSRSLLRGPPRRSLSWESNLACSLYRTHRPTSV